MSHVLYAQGPLCFRRDPNPNPYHMVMDGSCIAQVFPSRKLIALAYTIHADIHTGINIIYTHTHWPRLDLWKCLLKKESFELGFDAREGDISSLVTYQTL